MTDYSCNIVARQKCISLTKVPQRVLQTITTSALIWIQRQGMWCCDEVWRVSEGDNCSKIEKRDNYIKRKSKKGKRLNNKRTWGFLNGLSLLYPSFTCFSLLSLRILNWEPCFIFSESRHECKIKETNAIQFRIKRTFGQDNDIFRYQLI